MEKLLGPVLYIAAPFFYWNAGRAFFLLGGLRDRQGDSLYGLLGVLVFAMAGQVLYYLGAPAGAFSVGLGAMACAFSLSRAVTPKEKEALLFWLLAFAIAGLGQALVPYPGLGKWSGDWNFHFQLSRHLVAGTVADELVARPPLFAAAFIPLLWLSNGLLSYQTGNALITAASALAVFYAARKFRISLTPRLFLLTLFTTPFFLLHDTYPWPKFLSGACLLVAMVAMARQLRRPRLGLAASIGAWTALSINAHHSAVLCLPLLFFSFRRGLWKRQKHLFVSALVLVGVGACFVLPYELWTLNEFGWKRRFLENAGVSWRYGNPYADFPRILFTTFVTRGPLEVAGFIAEQFDAKSLLQWAALAFFCLSTWVTAMAGTFGGLFLPWVLNSQWRVFFGFTRSVFRSFPFLALCAGLTVLFHTLAFPHDTLVGTTQAGLVPLCFLCFLLLYAFLARVKDPKIESRIVVCSLGLGTLPFVLSQFPAAVLIGLPASLIGAGPGAILRSQDEDAKIYFGSQLVSWGEGLFLWGLLFTAVFLVAAVALRSAPNKVDLRKSHVQ
ncbi:hypothetical protein K2X33_14685 [bacterium]|nr:hypothetical protein [bacterium]